MTINPMSKAVKQWFPHFNPVVWHGATLLVNNPAEYQQLAIAYVDLHWRIHRNYHDLFEKLRSKPTNYDEICWDADHHAKMGFDLCFSNPPNERPNPELWLVLCEQWFNSNTAHDEKYNDALSSLASRDYRSYLYTKHWKTVRYAMLLMLGARCMKCKKPNMWGELSNLHVHHVTYERVGNEKATDLLLLCSDCHKNEHEPILGIPPATAYGVLNAGDMVMHERFGVGIVIDIKPQSNDRDITVDFGKGDIKTFSDAFQKLEKIETDS